MTAIVLTVLLLSACFMLFGCSGGSTPTDQFCVDGTLPGSCSSTRPHYCTNDLVFIDAADLCGCPASQEPAGSTCVPN